MTKQERIDRKAGNQKRREAILKASHGKKKGDNLCIYLGGVMQASRTAKNESFCRRRACLWHEEYSY